MKSVSNFFLSGCLFLLNTACNNELQPEVSIEKHDIAMEVNTHVTLIDQTEYLQEGLHDDFLTHEVTDIVNQQPFLKQKMKRDDNSPDVDTIFSYDEIPLIKETKNCTRIFTDGSMESVTEYLTPLSENLIFQLTETPIPDKSRIALTTQKDGMLTAYNAASEILMQEAFPVSDMRDFIDTIKVYVKKMSQEEPDKANKLRSKIKSFKQYLTTGSNIHALSNGNLIVESPIDNEHNRFNIYPGIKGILKSRIELNPEMTKTLQYDIFQGDNLIQRKKYTYNPNKNLMNLHHNKEICENPETIETLTLILNPKGYPVIRHSKEFYKMNQTLYYFK